MPLFKCSSGKATPKKVIAYITDKNKAELVSVRNLFEDEDYARQFTDTQNLFGKGKKFDERKYYHIKLSCARQDNVSPQQAQRYAEEMAELLFPEHECVIATHTDTKTVHSHIVVNAVNPVTGRKLHITSDEYGRMKDEANRIGEKYGFSYTDWRKGAKHKRTSSEKHIILKGGTSWKEELREVIQEGTSNAKTEQEFKAYLKECYGVEITRSEELREVIQEGTSNAKTEQEFKAYLKECYGVEITRSGKDYSYLHPEKKKPVRGARLGQNYTKSEVLKRIGKQNYRQKSSTDFGRRGRNHNGQSAGNGAKLGGGQSFGRHAGRIITEGLGAVEREMQQLSFAAECASSGLEAESERLNREQRKVRERLERERRERDEKAGKTDGQSDGNEGEGNEGSSNGYGKGD